MNNSLPYKVVYAIGDQSCTKCFINIKTGRLQLAIMVQSDDDDCHYPKWYHMKCFFQTRLPRTEAAFDGFARLRNADQLAIKVHLGTLDSDPDVVPNIPKVPDFGIEYARVDRDSCKECQQKIALNQLRIMNVVYDVTSTSYDGQANWYHVICFVRSRSELGWLQSAEALPGFKRLSEEDKEMTRNQIPMISRELYKPMDSRKSEVNGNQAEHAKLIEKQNKEYYELFDNLSQLSEGEQDMILLANFQLLPASRLDRQHQLTDIIYFGSLNPCDKCGIGDLIFDNFSYVCSHIGQWSKCSNEVKEPQRRQTFIDKSLMCKYPFLQAYQTVRTRLLHSFRLCDDNGQDLVYAQYKHPPLFNMEFALVGVLKKSKAVIERTINSMGGKVVSVIHNKLAAVISCEFEVVKMGAQMKTAKKYNIQVICEDFLTEVHTCDPFLYIISKSLSDWGGDPYSRIKQCDSYLRDADYYTKSLPQKMTYKWKDGCAVDPECGLEDNAHVFCCTSSNRKYKYSVILGLVDIENDRNSYYRMQLLESNELKMYWIFESWGRISTVIGSKRLTNYRNLKVATDMFKAIYKDKTANNFGNIRFFKRPGKYYHLDIEFGPSKRTLDSVLPTLLSSPVFGLMKMLFDIRQMESMMVSCDLDMKQMPLGKISAKQIRSAMSVLKDISKLIHRNGTIAELRDASNKFYTMIPHGFSVNRPTIIDSIQVVNEKNEMLESLLNMELIYELLDGQNGKGHPMDACYHRLKSDIFAVDKNSFEFCELVRIVRDTHGATHNLYTLDIIEVFKVQREGEADRFRTYDGLSNHQLLWHGSRLMNFVSILSNGLKIAPPEAPHTGYMFGKGIYFSDMVSKAANYCHTSRIDNTGLLLLCEVALGQMHDLYFANSNIVGIPNLNQQSVRACGATYPTTYSQIDGIFVANGTLLTAQYATALHYNEYIVYDPAQVKIKFLVKVRFNYR